MWFFSADFDSLFFYCIVTLMTYVSRVKTFLNTHKQLFKVKMSVEHSPTCSTPTTLWTCLYIVQWMSSFLVSRFFFCNVFYYKLGRYFFNWIVSYFFHLHKTSKTLLWKHFTAHKIKHIRQEQDSSVCLHSFILLQIKLLC